MLSFDRNLLDSLISAQDNAKLKYVLHLNNQQYDLEDVSVVNSPTPVNSPTTRGGVYFSDKFAYKVKGTIHDLSVVPLLTKTMLGPNTDFGEIKISTRFETDGKQKEVLMSTNLTNSMQTSSHIELNMILVSIESV